MNNLTSRASWVRIALAAGMAAAIAATGAAAQAQEIGDARHGLSLARTMCSECHLVDKVAGRSTNPASPTFETIAKTPGLTSAALYSVLQSSHRTMPNIVIKGADAKDIVAYILSLKDGD
jgi:mono/diheme cytochrome c family protein